MSFLPPGQLSTGKLRSSRTITSWKTSSTAEPYLHMVNVYGSDACHMKIYPCFVFGPHPRFLVGTDVASLMQVAIGVRQRSSLGHACAV